MLDISASYAREFRGCEAMRWRYLWLWNPKYYGGGVNNWAQSIAYTLFLDVPFILLTVAANTLSIYLLSYSRPGHQWAAIGPCREIVQEPIVYH